MTALIILLLLAGLLLMTVELVVIPGFGVAGIMALICFGAGSVFAFNEFGVLGGIGVVVVTLLVGTVLVILLMRSKAAKNMELKEDKGKAGVPDDLDVWVGQEGVASSMLRPSGTGQFGREKLTVLTEGTFVKKGSPIKVVRIEGGKLVVEPLEDDLDIDKDRAGGEGAEIEDVEKKDAEKKNEIDKSEESDLKE